MKSDKYPRANRLKKQLQAAYSQNEKPKKSLIQVPGIGHGISSAYEQLRNSAEYTEDHLLLQRAARRFYRRNISFHAHRKIDNIGEELVIELTQAGYLENGSVSSETARDIQKQADHYVDIYWKLRKRKVSSDQAQQWIQDILSVSTADMLDPHHELAAFAYFAYEHYLELFPKDAFSKNSKKLSRFEISLYVATNRALLKSDLSRVRYDLINLYRVTTDDLTTFIQFNKDISQIFYSDLTQRLRRAVIKYGAPLRILKRLIEEHPDIASVLDKREDFLAMYENQTFIEYKAVRRRLNKGLIKSIIFLLITKVIVGVAIEVPYDLLTVGIVDYVALGINLLFPPLYMASFKLGLRPPSIQNAQALEEYIDKALFSDEMPLKPSLRSMTRSISAFSKFIYSLMFLIPFALTLFALSLLGFNAIQMVIFFVFLSTASFLGFRLSQTIRDLELVTQDVGLLQVIRDFFYLPFTMAGQWLSGKYAKINLVGVLLDMLIELPLKTVLRLIRQWILFLNERREQIY